MHSFFLEIKGKVNIFTWHYETRLHDLWTSNWSTTTYSNKTIV